MNQIMFTGGSGLVGSNVVPLLRQKYQILAPTRKELDLMDSAAVEQYVDEHHVDLVFHSANPNPVKNVLDQNNPMLRGSLRCFMNFYRIRHKLKHFYFFGSGAELDKTRDMNLITEEEFDRSIPQDDYGFAKYIMTTLARQSDNVTNLRLFACYGPGDWESKFITHCIRSVVAGQNITIRQDCYFDYLQVFDLVPIISHFIEYGAAHSEYNICTGTRVRLSEIAETVLRLMDSPLSVKILIPGMNKEYTASNARLLGEMDGFRFTTLEDGIKIQIASEKEQTETKH